MRFLRRVSLTIAVLLAALLLGAPTRLLAQAIPLPVPIPAPIADLVPASPKQPWIDLATAQINPGSPWWSDVLLYIPNRILDFIDIFRVDVGFGPSAGAVVRVTEYGQVGIREMLPASVRVGDLGRRFPGMIETSNEFGIGPAYVESTDRSVCPGEIGLGADVMLAGAYAGVCVDEFADFLAGLVFIDFKGDDYK